MHPLRSGLLAAARSPRLRRFGETSRITRPVVDRFVAGADQAAALRATDELLGSGRLVSLDFLGEDVTSREQAGATVEAYQSLLAALAASGAARRAEVSVKLSAIGQALPSDGDKISLDNARAICAAAADAGTTVTLDMEDHSTTDATLTTLAELRVDFAATGAVLQSHLHRTESDCRDLATGGSRVRLCKGAYAEPAAVAYRGEDVAASYQRCLAILLAGPGYPMIATHDPALIAAGRDLIARHVRRPDSYEFQMLFGVRTAEQQALAAAGQPIRVYVPFGQQWYGYFMRRLAERPANVRFFLRSLVSRS